MIHVCKNKKLHDYENVTLHSCKYNTLLKNKSSCNYFQ